MLPGSEALKNGKLQVQKDSAAFEPKALAVGSATRSNAFEAKQKSDLGTGPAWVWLNGSGPGPGPAWAQ